MKKIVSMAVLVAACAIYAAPDSPDQARATAILYQNGKYQEAIARFNASLPTPSEERNKMGHYAIRSYCQLKQYQLALDLAERLTAENKESKAWECRFKFHQMTALNLLKRPEDGLKVISAADAVPPAFLGEYFCLRGNLLNSAGQWRQALDTFDHGTSVSNDFAGRARLSIARLYEAQGFPLPALEAYLRTLSMLHVTPQDRDLAFAGAVKLLPQVDRGREEVQDVLLPLQSELKSAEAGKLLEQGKKAEAGKLLKELTGDSNLPLPLREFARGLLAK